MSKLTRRSFMKNSLAAAAGVGITAALPSRVWSNVLGANDTIRVAIVGLGGNRLRYKEKGDAGFMVQGGKGSNMISAWSDIPGVRVVALCDPDSANLQRDLAKFKDTNEKVDTYTDVRKLLEDKNIDALYIATTNHWHALITIWGCQAGKDIYVEKPVSYCIWEGQQMVKAARKYNKIVQGGTGMRSDTSMRDAFDFARQGNLGKINLVRAICYRFRENIGKVTGPQPVPTTVDYELWTGPAAMVPLMRKNLHYDWHWIWNTGNGEMGDLGAHYLDAARWAVGQSALPPRAISLGGRFGGEDDGQTPNTHVAFFDYEPVPILFEIRGLGKGADVNMMDHYRGLRQGVIVQCENGYVAYGIPGGGWAYDKDNKKIKQFAGGGEEGHVENFIKAMRSRKTGDLNAEIQESHISAALSHVANTSYLVGKQTLPDEIQENIKGKSELADAFGRMKEHLVANKVDLSQNKIVLGPMLSLDTAKEVFVGPQADSANKLLKREKYREPFVVPETV